jgi:hypothetical protein
MCTKTIGQSLQDALLIPCSKLAKIFGYCVAACLIALIVGAIACAVVAVVGFDLLLIDHSFGHALRGL